MLEAYRHHVAERAALGIPPLPLSAQQTAALIVLLRDPPPGEAGFLLELLAQRVPAGVDDAARVKAGWLAAIASGGEHSALVSAEHATRLLGTMLGGYNVAPLVDLLDDAALGPVAAEGLAHMLVSTPSTTWKRRRRPATPTPRRCCRAGPMRSGSPAARKCRSR